MLWKYLEGTPKDGLPIILCFIIYEIKFLQNFTLRYSYYNENFQIYGIMNSYSICIYY